MPWRDDVDPRPSARPALGPAMSGPLAERDMRLRARLEKELGKGKTQARDGRWTRCHLARLRHGLDDDARHY